MFTLVGTTTCASECLTVALWAKEKPPNLVCTLKNLYRPIAKNLHNFDNSRGQFLIGRDNRKFVVWESTWPIESVGLAAQAKRDDGRQCA
jgi:hypothetical protein